MVPAERLVMRTAIRGDQFNGAFANARIGYRHERIDLSKATTGM
jgi:hypothetical protein